jgi:hypothetical protein
MPSTSYQVFVIFTAGTGSNQAGCVTVSLKAVTGFSVLPINCNGGAALNANSSFSWMAIIDK